MVTETIEEMERTVPSAVLPVEYEKVSAKRKKELLGGQLALRELMGRFHPIAKKGRKPYLPNASKKISVSHTGIYVAVAMADHGIAVDIELRNRNIEKLKDKFLSEDEWVHCADDPLVPLLYWTCKECLFKIAPFQGIIFSKELHVEPFQLSEDFTVTGVIARENIRLSHRIQVLQKGELVVSTLVNTTFETDAAG